MERHFYVDDGLVSVPSEAEAIDLLQRTQVSLAETNLRFHKTVMEAFSLVRLTYNIYIYIYIYIL